MKPETTEKILFVIIAILTVLLFFIGVAILVGTILIYRIINYTMNSIITILFIVFGVITGLCIFGLFCIRNKPMACLIFIISLGITSTAFVSLGTVMYIAKDDFIDALIKNLQDSQEAIIEIKKQIDNNIDIAKIVMLSVPAVPLLLLIFTYCYRRVCKTIVKNQRKFNEE